MKGGLQRTYHEKSRWMYLESAACLVARDPLLDRDMARAGDEVVLVNTVSPRKYLPNTRLLT